MLQRRLLSEKNLTFTKAVEIVQGAEAAEKSSKRLQTGDVSSIGHIASTIPNRGKAKSGNRKPCYRCGEYDHPSDKCRFRQSVCRKCCKLGHIARVCRSNTTPDAFRPSKSGRGRSGCKKAHTLSREQATDEQDPGHHLKMGQFLCLQCAVQRGTRLRLCCG